MKPQQSEGCPVGYQKGPFPVLPCPALNKNMEDVTSQDGNVYETDRR